MPPFGFWPRQASNIGGSPSRVTTEFGGSCWSPERCWGRLESRTEGLFGNETVYKKAQTSAQNAPREEVEEEEEEDGVGGGENLHDAHHAGAGLSRGSRLFLDSGKRNPLSRTNKLRTTRTGSSQ